MHVKRIYTDSRFPGWLVENDGSVLFQVLEDGQPVATFHANENTANSQVSEQFALRRADDYFNHLAAMNRMAELDAQARVTPQRVVPPAMVEKAMAAARAEQNPVRKAARKEQALRLMAQEESLPEQTVNRLLYEL
jgi:hypothetical protein